MSFAPPRRAGVCRWFDRERERIERSRDQGTYLHPKFVDPLMTELQPSRRMGRYLAEGGAFGATCRNLGE